MYLLSCKNSVANDIRRRLWPHNHLHSDIHAYSLMVLNKFILNIFNYF